MGTGHSEQGNEDTSWRIQDHPPHPHQLTQFPRTATLQLSTRTRGNTRLLFLQQPPKNGTVLQPPQQTSFLFRLKALGSAPARDNLPSRMSTGACGMRKVPCKCWWHGTSAQPSLVPRRPGPTSSSSRVYLPVTSSRELFLTPCHQAFHPASWVSSPSRARSLWIMFMGPGPVSCGPPGPCMCWQSLVCVGQGYAGDCAGKPQHASGQQEGSLTSCLHPHAPWI